MLAVAVIAVIVTLAALTWIGYDLVRGPLITRADIETLINATREHQGLACPCPMCHDIDTWEQEMSEP